MAIRKIRFIEFAENNQPSLYSVSGSKERNSTLRESHQIDAEYNDATGQITIHNARKGKDPEEVILHLSGVRHIQVYPADGPATKGK
jgi:hypothetical protein